MFYKAVCGLLAAGTLLASDVLATLPHEKFVERAERRNNRDRRLINNMLNKRQAPSNTSDFRYLTNQTDRECYDASWSLANC